MSRPPIPCSGCGRLVRLALVTKRWVAIELNDAYSLKRASNGVLLWHPALSVIPPHVCSDGLRADEDAA